ncbi:MAG: dienelactone hydrolase family protein, partial [Knoellia sp.]
MCSMQIHTVAMSEGRTAEVYVARPTAVAAGLTPAGRTQANGADLPGVLFFMDAIGLRPRIAEMAQRIANWGYVVLAPNVFYRFGTVEELAPTTDLTDPNAREEFFKGAMSRVRALTSKRAERDIPAYL